MSILVSPKKELHCIYRILDNPPKDLLQFISRQRKRCLWCGHILYFIDIKTGKERNYCNSYCNKRYNYLLWFLQGKSTPAKGKKPRIIIFREYCLIRLIFRFPAQELNEQLKKACKTRKKLIIPAIKVR